MDLPLAKKFLTLSVVAIPFIDWPWFPGDSYVRPVSIFPVILGCLFLVSSKLLSGKFTIRDGNQPFEIFNVFVAIALFITAINLVYFLFSGNSSEYQGRSLFQNSIKSSISLLIGWTFYFFFNQVSTTDAAIRLCRMILIVSVFMLITVYVQAAAIFGEWPVAEIINNKLLQVVHYRGTLEHGKAYGWTPEGSMLADHLMAVVIPFLLASISTGHSILGRSVAKPRIEIVLLLFALLGLVLSLSRIGFITLVFLLGFYFLLDLIVEREGALRKSSFKKFMLIFVVLLLISLLVWVFFREFFMALISTMAIDTFRDGSVVSNITRSANMYTALKIFLDQPFGVGLGFFPYYYNEHLPPWAFMSPEVQYYLGQYSGSIQFREYVLPNAKGLLPRLLAETGIVGTFIFGYFYITLLRRTFIARRTAQTDHVRFLSSAMLYSLIAIIPLSFNVDTFAFPHYYFIFAVCGLLSMQVGMSTDQGLRKI